MYIDRGKSYSHILSYKISKISAIFVSDYYITFYFVYEKMHYYISYTLILMLMTTKKTNAGTVIMSTFPNQESAVHASRELIVNKKLCACVNLTKVRSIYFWHDKLEDHEEFVAFFKTTTLAAAQLKSEIKKIHPYELPEILELKIKNVSKPYLSWLVESTIHLKYSKHKND
jgi:periplasmic divalent cation tolerance protein